MSRGRGRDRHGGSTGYSRGMLTTPRLNLALFLARVPLGAYFALSGYNKIFGPGVKAFADGAMKMGPERVPPDFRHAFLTALPFVELASGLFVIVGLLVRTFSFVQSLLLISFLIAAWKGYHVAHVPGSNDGSSPFDLNVVLLGLSLCLTLLGAGEWHAHRMFRRRRRVIVTEEPLVATTARGTPLV